MQNVNEVTDKKALRALKKKAKEARKLKREQRREKKRLKALQREKQRENNKNDMNSSNSAATVVQQSTLPISLSPQKQSLLLLPMNYCLRLDLLGIIPELNKIRNDVFQLPRKHSFDHIFEKMRADGLHEYLKAKPLHTDNESRYVRRQLVDIAQSAEDAEPNYSFSDKLYTNFVEKIAKSSRIPKVIKKRNAILKDSTEAMLREKIEQQQQKRAFNMKVASLGLRKSTATTAKTPYNVLKHGSVHPTTSYR